MDFKLSASSTHMQRFSKAILQRQIKVKSWFTELRYQNRQNRRAKIDVIKTPIHLSNKYRRTVPILMLASVTALSGCVSSSPKKSLDIRNLNEAPQASSAKPNATVPDIASLRLDTKLNIQFDWWKLLQSPQLIKLIDQLFYANPTVGGAQNILLKLQQNEISREGYFYSSINVKDEANGQGRLLFAQDIPVSDEAKFIGDAYYEIHAWKLTVGYVPEMLRVHQLPVATKAEIEVQNLQMEATYRTLAGNLIACGIQDASLRAQMSAVRKIVAIEQNLLAIVHKRVNAGQATQMEEASREQSVESSSQALLHLKSQFEQIRGIEKLLLNVNEDKELPENIDLGLLNLPVKLPLELSAALIEQRPDVRAGQLEMLPANTKYQTTANMALKNVENTLIAIHNDAITLKAAVVSEQENYELLDASRKNYQANMIGYQDVLITEQGFQFATLRAAQARAKQLGNAVMLYHALGGSWWAMDDAVKLEIDSELNHKKSNR